MNLTELFLELKREKVRVNLDNDRLCITSHSGKVSEELLGMIRHYKQPIKEYLAKATTGAAPGAIPRIEDQEYYNLSNSQEGFWFMEQLQKNETGYLQSGSFSIDGDFDLEILKQTFEFVIRRHEALRTVFIEVQGLPKQKVKEWEELGEVLEFADVRNDPRDVLEIIRQEHQHRLSLSEGPLFKGKLYRIRDQSYYFYYRIHHMINDGWSIGILNTEIAQVYNRLLDGEAVNLSPLPIQYRDFTAWQKQYLDSERGKMLRQFWLNQLSGPLPNVNLPTWQPRPRVITSKGAVIDYVIGPELVGRIKALGNRNRCTLFMTLLSVVNLVLHKFTSQTDIIVSSDFGGRHMVETENNIGLFLDVFIIRNTFSKDDSFNALLGKVKEAVVQAYDHRHYPVTRIIKDLGLRRDPSRNALFDIIVGLKNFDDRVLDQELVAKEINNNLEIEFRNIGPVSAVTDLNFSFWETSRNLVMGLCYNTDLFTPEFIDELGQCTLRAFERVVADPGQPIGSLSLLPPGAPVHVASRSTLPPPPFGPHTLERILRRERQHPHTVAVTCGDLHLTYRELVRRARTVAQALASMNVAPGNHVPVVMNQEADYAVAALGILLAGAVVAPLNPHWLPAQLHAVVNEVLNAQVVIVGDSYGYLRADLGAVCVGVDELLGFEGEAALPPAPYPEALFTLFTSGSTGAPKGVQLLNEGILNRLLWMNEHFGGAAAASVLHASPISFDASVWQVLWPLMNGGTLVMPPTGYGPVNGVELSRLLRAYRIRICDFVPSLFARIMHSLPEGTPRPAHLQHVILGGEALTAGTISPFRAAFPHVRITNLYGPAEATIGCIFHQVGDGDGGNVPIGLPISNVKAYILDEAMQPVLPGVKGELYLAGVCLTRGYVNAPAKTREKFMPNPFDRSPRYATLYRTGDLVYLENGRIVFAGRSDDTVKIRGVAIDLRDVRMQCLRVAPLREAVVRVEGEGDRQEIVLYYTTRTAISETELRKTLSAALPLYMTPRQLVPVDEIPLTSNGKVDLEKLRSFSTGRPPLSEPAATFFEQELLDRWRHVLRNEHVGVTDNFFDVGGNSLVAIELVVLLNETYPGKIRVSDIFTVATVRELAALLEERVKA